MRQRISASLVRVLVLLCLLLPTAQPAAAAPRPRLGSPSIRIAGSTFAPARGECPDLPLGLAIAEYAASQCGYYIVQFGGPVRPAWRDQIVALGAEILDYVPDFA